MSVAVSLSLSLSGTYFARNEDGQWPGQCEDPRGFDGSHDSIDLQDLVSIPNPSSAA